MSNEVVSLDTSLTHLANQLIKLDKNIILIFAFNATGKTRFSVEYKNITKKKNKGKHSGVYYNAYSEDLFHWDNDPENEGRGIKLNVISSGLNQFHSLFDETKLRAKLSIYKPKFDFIFNYFQDSAKGIESVRFYLKSEKPDREPEYIKISRGEERIFIWCFFLTLFDIQGWIEKTKSHFFIDDPVSSLDDHNIFITATTLMDLIDEHYKNTKIVITTHHIGIFSILADWLKKGEKADNYKGATQLYILKNKNNKLELLDCKKDVFLYHLELLQILQQAVHEKKLYAYHFAILRQVLENISSFLGVGRISYVLEQIGVDADKIARIVNTLSHKTVFRYEAKEMVPDNEEMFIEIFNKIQDKYKFITLLGV